MSDWMTSIAVHQPNKGWSTPSGLRVAVIDPENRKQVEQLADLMAWALHSEDTPRLQAALREFANPKPPKPDEPQGLGAVVEAVNNNRFVRVGEAGWVHEDDPTSQPCDWRGMAVLRVLSEGVQP